MFKTMRARKGVTLAEITVALALVSIMITLVVSFVISITTRTKANAAYDAMRRDCIYIEAVAESWMQGVTTQKYSINGATNAVSVTATKDTASCDLKFSEGAIISNVPETNLLTLRTETVKSVVFDVLINEITDADSNEKKIVDVLLICTVTCVNPENGHKVSFNICVNPRVGEAVN